MKLTITKSEGAILMKLLKDRKTDILNANGDSKQCEVLSKLSKKIARQVKNPTRHEALRNNLCGSYYL